MCMVGSNGGTIFKVAGPSSSSRFYSGLQLEYCSVNRANYGYKVPLQGMKQILTNILDTLGRHFVAMMVPQMTMLVNIGFTNDNQVLESVWSPLLCHGILSYK